jgi:hypothetical protein
VSGQKPSDFAASRQVRDQLAVAQPVGRGEASSSTFAHGARSRDRAAFAATPDSQEGLAAEGRARELWLEDYQAQSGAIRHTCLGVMSRGAT